MNYHTDYLLDERMKYRAARNFTISDQIRDTLDGILVFVFDRGDGGQDVYYLTPSYFKNKARCIVTEAMSYRQYVEYRIKKDIQAEKAFDSWLFTQKQKRA